MLRRCSLDGGPARGRIARFQLEENPTMTAQRQTGLRVLLAGATGLVGGHCLTQLLADEDIGHVTVLTRRALERTHPKLATHIVNFDHLGDHAEAINADIALCCLGTTHRAAGSPEAFAKVDHIYVAELARLAAARGTSRFVLVSAVGADPGSPVFYNRIKGRAEAAVSELPFKAVHILRPSLLLGERPEPRPVEDWSKPFAPLWSLFLWGPFSRYRPIAAETVAARMVELVKSDQEGVHIHHFNE
jgi:uncharacterized protein YbjT (DUF2867 family)